MPLIPIRGLASGGIITDIDPYDLPTQAFSGGVNVRFAEGRVQHAPVFRNVATLGTSAPRGLFSISTDLGDSLYLGYLNGRVTKITTSTEDDYSITDYTNSDSDGVYSNAVLARVLYVNREDRVPWALIPETTEFVELDNWNSEWRTRLLRTFNGALVALNVTKSGTQFPTMVKTSDFALDGNVPATWDETDPTANTYENVISEMKGSIVEAQVLRNTLMIYSKTETWAMQATGDTGIYQITNVFKDAGCINANCAVEIDGKHYVFGSNDIFVHDGLTKVSVADKRVRKFIFSGLNNLKARRCYTVHNPVSNEVAFCYVTGDRFLNFTGGTGCNRAAVLNLTDNTWTFYDLPFTFAGAQAAVSSVTTWATAPGSWNTFGASWLEQEDGSKRGVLMIGEANTDFGLSDRLYAHDLLDNAVFAFPVDPAANKPCLLERDGIDLDEVGEELRGYKLIRAIYPEGRMDKSGAMIEFSFGASDGFNDNVLYQDYQTYNGDDLYKVDFMSAGRYLAMRMRYTDIKQFSLSGFDLDIEVTGRR